MSTLINYQPPAEPFSRRLNVVMSAATLFLRHGIAQVRMTDIAEFSGVGVASLYRRFGTKTTLAIAAGREMWHRFNLQVLDITREEGFARATGGQRLMMLFAHYCDEYVRHPDFVRFIDELDRMLVDEHVPQEELVEYGNEVDSFAKVFAHAYEDGVRDGSITREVDFPIFYRTVAHAMMGIAQRILRGDIIPSDDYSQGKSELECEVQMARIMLGIDE